MLNIRASQKGKGDGLIVRINVQVLPTSSGFDGKAQVGMGLNGAALRWPSVICQCFICRLSPTALSSLSLLFRPSFLLPSFPSLQPLLLHYSPHLSFATTECFGKPSNHTETLSTSSSQVGALIG